jgi:hypothetical protein
VLGIAVDEPFLWPAFQLDHLKRRLDPLPDAADEDTASTLGILIVDVAGAHHGAGTATQVCLVLMARHVALAVGQPRRIPGTSLA